MRSLKLTLCCVLGLNSLQALALSAQAAAVDPYAQVALVTNTVAWPYNSTTFGTDSFTFGSAESQNADALILADVRRHGFHFPEKFGFGVACSAYQYEGHRVAPSAQQPDGIGWSIWDVFSEKGSWLNPYGTNIAEVAPTSQVTQPNGAVAIDGFNPSHYQQDLQWVQGLGVSYYRLSISWPRLFPHANMTQPDPEGVAYYRTLLSKLQAAHVNVLVTLYHWDMPAWLYNFGDPQLKAGQERTYGWLDMRPAKENLALLEFQKYVAAAYRAFGPYTSHFSTFNEPLTFTVIGLSTGGHAPGLQGYAQLRALNPALYGATPTENLQRLPYLQAINLIKAHYLAYKTMHALYQQDPAHYNREAPEVSMVLNSDWAEPYRINAHGHYHPADVAAAKRNMDYMLGWWLQPIMFGHWPASMQSVYEHRITQVGLDKGDDSCLQADGKPVSCRRDASERLTNYIATGGALDVLAINHYTGYFVADLDYAKSGAVPRNQYQEDPSTQVGWNADQNNYPTQFRQRLYGDHGPAPTAGKIFVIGNSGNKPWLRQTWFVYRKLLQYINKYYLQVPGYTKQQVPFSKLSIDLTENGTSIYHESQQPSSKPDVNRITYLLGNLGAVQQAVNQDHVPVNLYTYWSVADNFEWAEGYDSRFGLLWVDYANQLQRIPKQSYWCYQQVIAHAQDGVFPTSCLLDR